LLTVPIFLAITAGVYLQTGLMLYMSTLATFGFTLITAYITQKKESGSLIKYLVPALVAAIPTLVSGSIEKYLEIKSKPTFTIETKIQDQRIDIGLTILTGKLSSFSIDYPVQGIITSIVPHNSLTEVQKTHFQVRGSADGISLNNAEITSDDIKSNVNLQYTIFFKPVTIPSTWVIYGRDTYTITYTWRYKDKEDSNTAWHLVKNDQKTERPWVEARDVTITHELVPMQEERSK
jgi:hypothetical protein